MEFRNGEFYYKRNYGKYAIFAVFLLLTLVIFFFGGESSEGNIKYEVIEIENKEDNKEKSINENNIKNENNVNDNNNNLDDMPPDVNLTTLKKNINKTKEDYAKYIEEQRLLFIEQSHKIQTFFLILFSSILLGMYLWSGYKIQQSKLKKGKKSSSLEKTNNEYKLLINEDEIDDLFSE